MSHSYDTNRTLLVSDFADALNSQDACNISGMLFSLSEIQGRINHTSYKHGYGTDWRNRHPIVRLYIHHISFLCGNGESIDSSEYHACSEFCRRVTSPIDPLPTDFDYRKFPECNYILDGTKQLKSEGEILKDIEQLREAGMRILESIVNRHGYGVAASYVANICDHTKIEERCKEYGETKQYALADQCCYALSNLYNWTVKQHPQAKELKSVMKTFMEKYQKK